MPDYVLDTLVTCTVMCAAFNVCWWLSGRTLSESFPGFIVVPIMLATVVCFFIAFRLLFLEICTTYLSPDWGYINKYGEFAPLAKDLAHILAVILVIGTAVMLYRDEGKMAKSKYKNPEE